MSHALQSRLNDHGVPHGVVVLRRNDDQDDEVGHERRHEVEPEHRPVHDRRDALPLRDHDSLFVHRRRRPRPRHVVTVTARDVTALALVIRLFDRQIVRLQPPSVQYRLVGLAFVSVSGQLGFRGRFRFLRLVAWFRGFVLFLSEPRGFDVVVVGRCVLLAVASVLDAGWLPVTTLRVVVVAHEYGTVLTVDVVARVGPLDLSGVSGMLDDVKIKIVLAKEKRK